MKKKVLFEDTVSYYNKWVSGQASREFGAIKMKYDDLVGKGDKHNEQDPNNAKASNVIPYPLVNTVSILGDLVTNHDNALRDFRLALKHPLIVDDKKATAELNGVINCLTKASEELKQIFIIFGKGAK